jgi:hypothetical protein
VVRREVHGCSRNRLRSLSGDAQGLAVSVSLRRRPDGKRYLVFKWEGRSTLHWEAMEVTPVVLTRFAAIIEDVTKRVSAH